MSDDNHIHSIILQLIEVSQGQAVDNAFLENGSQREEHIRNLTPIYGVSEGPTPPHEPENTFLVGKVTPKGSKPTFEDIMTPITSKELYPHYLELPKDEFIKRFNKSLYDYIGVKLKEAKDNNVPDDENIWMQPNAAFVEWFQEQGIDIDSQASFYKDEDDIIDVEYYQKRGCTEAQIKYIRLYVLTKKYRKAKPDSSIRNAVKIVYKDNKSTLGKWSENSLMKYYLLGENLHIDT